MVELGTHANIFKHVRATLVVQETVNHCNQYRQAFGCASYRVHFYFLSTSVNLGVIYCRVGVDCLGVSLAFIYNKTPLSLRDPKLKVIGVF